MNHTENNMLVAEFMGFKNTTPTDKDFNIFEKEGESLMEAMSMKYHSSWDWLIPVVQKIQTIEPDQNATYGLEVRFSPFTYSLESIYKGVIEFIKKYNHENK